MHIISLGLEMLNGISDINFEKKKLVTTICVSLNMKHGHAFR